MKFQSKKQYGDGYYIFTQTDTGETPMIKSDIIFLTLDKKRDDNNGITFILDKEDSPKLYEEICKMEDDTANLIDTLNSDVVSFLPAHICMEIFTNNKDGHKHYMRPNYWSDQTSPRLYVKGNLGSMRIMDMNGRYLSPSDLGVGFYQFTIRANTIYFGEHKNIQHVVNLQLRVVQVRYSPTDPDRPALLSSPTNPDAEPGSPLMASTPKTSSKKQPKVPGAPRKPKLVRQNAMPPSPVNLFPETEN